MREFFKGWRRKAGCGLLIIATALTVLWIRTTVVADFVQLNFVRFGSLRGGLYCFFPTRETWHWQTIPEEELQCSIGHMSLAELLNKELWEVPYGYAYYWQLILPLTLFSAYLNLCKPRPKQPTADPD